MNYYLQMEALTKTLRKIYFPPIYNHITYVYAYKLFNTYNYEKLLNIININKL